MRPPVALLLVLGILLGPVYYGYCLLLSGKKVQTIEMTERAARWTTADGSILRFSNGLAYRPIPLMLRPEMNRVTLRVNFTFDDGAPAQGVEKLNYQASLAQFDHTILQRPIEVRADRSGTRSVDVGPMQIPYPAEYTFVLAEEGEVSRAPIVSLDVVEKVEAPAKSIIWTGMALLIAAFIFALRDTVRAATRRHPR